MKRFCAIFVSLILPRTVNQLVLCFVSGTVYNVTNTRELNAAKFHSRITVILRYDFLSLFNADKWVKSCPPQTNEDRMLNTCAVHSYSIKEVMDIFGKSKEAVYVLLKRADINKIRIGKEIMLPKVEIDKLGKIEPEQESTPNERNPNSKLASKPIRL